MSSRLDVSHSHILPCQVICSCTDCRRYTFLMPDNQLIYGELEFLCADAYIITVCTLPILLLIYNCCLFIDKISMDLP